jgi:hypothetical protein
MKRNKHTLTTNKGHLFELNRTNWTLYRNFRDMYVNVESHMVAAGAAVKLDSHKWMDKEGNEVEELESFGMKVETQLTHPHCCLVMDETGGDTNMMKDSASGGKKFVGRKGEEVRQMGGKKGKNTQPLDSQDLMASLPCVLLSLLVWRKICKWRVELILLN